MSNRYESISAANCPVECVLPGVTLQGDILETPAVILGDQDATALVIEGSFQDLRMLLQHALETLVDKERVWKTQQRATLTQLVREFDAAGGRGVELADKIDELRRNLDTETGQEAAREPATLGSWYIEDEDGKHHGPMNYDEAVSYADSLNGRLVRGDDSAEQDQEAER